MRVRYQRNPALGWWQSTSLVASPAPSPLPRTKQISSCKSSANVAIYPLGNGAGESMKENSIGIRKRWSVLRVNSHTPRPIGALKGNLSLSI